MNLATLEDRLDFGRPEDYERLDVPGPKALPSGRLELPLSSLEGLAERAFSEIAFKLPLEQAEAFGAVASDRAASDADRFVAAELLRNAVIAAEGLLPLCQDTGTAIVYGWKGSGLVTAGIDSGGSDADSGAEDDAEALSRGAARAYAVHRLRNSQMGPLGFIEEANTGDNLPLLAELRVATGKEYRFCFSAKGGGSANRTSLSMESPALLEERALEARIRDRITSLGASGCPPYRISLVVGGQAPDEALYVLALASLGLLDRLGPRAEGRGDALRDPAWEARILAIAESTGVGAQFGGSRLALGARAIRLARHAASLPFAMGVACAAHRRARALVSAAGVFLERMEGDPARFLPAELPVLPGARRVDLGGPQAELGRELGRLEPGSFLLLSGTVVTARDAAHARFRSLVEGGRPLPGYLSRHPVFYAGPTEAAPGQVSGSFGPTTAGRMDGYMEMLVSRGASLVSIAKGGRSPEAARAIGAAGGAYLACVGGAAALVAREHVVSSEVIDYPELGMEAIRRVVLRDLPAMLVVDGRGRDFYALARQARG
ncbi:MAG: fumarate hydratase C-terminal domain-containing protein [Rectinemataceae bacterium]|jgi:fumarate hydratase class I